MKRTWSVLLIGFLLIFVLFSAGFTGEETKTVLIISEIVAKDTDGGPDWVELSADGVEGGEVISLSDYFLVDDKKGRTPEQLPDIILKPGEYIVIYAGGVEGNFVSFKLGGEDSVTLLYKGNIIDSVKWNEGDAPEGYSLSRFTNEAGIVTFMKSCLTPGTENKSLELSGESSAEEPLEDSDSLSRVGVNLFPENIVVDVDIRIDPGFLQAILDDPMAEEYFPATVTYNGVTVTNVALRTKGNSSLFSVASTDSERYSLKIDFNYYVEGQTLGGLRKLNLNNGFADPTFMREYLSYMLFKEAGVATPRNGYINLTVNGEEKGLFLAIEQIDKTFIEENYEYTEGDLYKPSGRGCDLVWNGDGTENYPGLFESLKTNEDTSNHEALLHFLEILNNGGDLEEVLNVDGALRYLVVSTVLENMDSYQGSTGHNYYLYFNNGKFEILPWDLNMSFAGFNHGGEEEQASLMIDEPTAGSLDGRILIKRLLENEEYLKKYHSLIEEFIEGPFKPEELEKKINEVCELISPYVEKDPTKFYDFETFEKSITESVEGATFGRNENMMRPGEGFAPPRGMLPPGMRPEDMQNMMFGNRPNTAGMEGASPTNQQLLFPQDPQAVLEMIKQFVGGGGPAGDGKLVGLIPFIEERYANVRGQLDGIYPSK